MANATNSTGSFFHCLNIPFIASSPCFEFQSEMYGKMGASADKVASYFQNETAPAIPPKFFTTCGNYTDWVANKAIHAADWTCASVRDTWNVSGALFGRPGQLVVLLGAAIFISNLVYICRSKPVHVAQKVTVSPCQRSSQPAIPSNCQIVCTNSEWGVGDKHFEKVVLRLSAFSGVSVSEPSTQLNGIYIAAIKKIEKNGSENRTIYQMAENASLRMILEEDSALTQKVIKAASQSHSDTVIVRIPWLDNIEVSAVALLKLLK